MTRRKVAILGSGNIGTDLMIKLLRSEGPLELAALVGIDPDSEGLARARDRGVWTTHEGVQGLAKMEGFHDLAVIFDATSTRAHHANAAFLAEHHPGVRLVDLTPAAIGPYCVPVVNLDEHIDAPNLNLVTCGGQATIPMVAAVAQVAKVHYAEIVASISSRSAGPGTRASIDSFTVTTARAIESVGGAAKGRALIILNPAEPPQTMRDTVFVLSEAVDPELVAKSVNEMVERVQSYVPGYRLKQDVQFDHVPEDAPLAIPGFGQFSGLKTSVFLEVEGAADYLPAYAGNLDIMTSAAVAVGERLVEAL